MKPNEGICLSLAFVGFRGLNPTYAMNLVLINFRC
jgi:hypothetical protein